MKVVSFISLFIILVINFDIYTYGYECICCEKGGLRRHLGINEALFADENDEHKLEKRYVDSTFVGHPKTKGDVWLQRFYADTLMFDQSPSLIKLLNKIAVEYLNQCAPFILYDTFVENSELSILQNLFQTFPLTFYHGKIDEHFRLKNKRLLKVNDNSCKSYILFLSDPLMARKIIGPQTVNKVIVVARSSQWKLQDFLTSESSSNIINLLVVGESMTADPKRERPYVLYTHRLYADGLGSNMPQVLTSWVKGVLSRPHINLFPEKFAHGFAGHRFVVAAVNQPPFIFRKGKVDMFGSVDVSWDGLEYRLMRLLAHRLNFTFEIMEPKNTIRIGSGEAVREEVQTRRADIGMAGAYITYDRLEDIDMTVSHSRDCAAFITLASKALPKYRAIMGPFQWQVWLAVTAVYMLGIFPIAFSDRLSLKHLIGNITEIENMFWYVFGTFTNSLTFSGKYSWSNTEKLSTRLLIGFYWMFTIIITACYTGSIIAFVTLPAFPDTVDSVNDLLGLFFRVSTLDKGGWQLWFANSTHVPTAKLYKKMEFVSTIEEGIGNVTKSFFWNYAFLGSRSQLEYLVQSNFSAQGLSKRSALHLSEECFAPFQVALTLPKHAVYIHKINELIHLFHQNGILIKLLNEVSWQMQRSKEGKLLQASSGASFKEIIREERQLTTADTEGMFLLLGAGFLIATLALISEVIGGFTNKCRQVIRRSRKSISSNFSSSRNSCDLENPEELRKHLERRAQRELDESNKPKSRFPGFDDLNLTRTTLKEIYGGYRRNESNIIFQSGQMMTESEAQSEDSSLGYEKPDSKADTSDEETFNHEAVVHFAIDSNESDDESIKYENKHEQEYEEVVGDIDTERNLTPIDEQFEKSDDQLTNIDGEGDKIIDHNDVVDHVKEEVNAIVDKAEGTFGEAVVHPTPFHRKILKSITSSLVNKNL